MTNEDLRTVNWVPELFLKVVDNIRTRGNLNPSLTNDRHERKIERYNKTLKDSGGAIVGLLATGQDITERKAAEEGSRRSKELLEKTFLSLDRAVFIVSAAEDPVTCSGEEVTMHLNSLTPG